MPWEPPPHEKDLYNEVFIDESSQTKFRYLIIGGIVVPMKYAAQLESDIIEARGSDLPLVDSDGEPRVIKWEKVWSARLEAYTRAVDAFFDFPKRHFPRSSLPYLDFHCTAVDTHKKDDHKFSDGDRDIGFNKEVYFLCLRIANRYPKALFHVYPDRRNTKTPPEIAGGIMNLGLQKRGDKRTAPIRRCQFEDPERKQALQVADILMGAVAFRLNGHYEVAKPDSAKKALCDYILDRAHIKRIHENTRDNARFTLFHRTFSRYPKGR